MTTEPKYSATQQASVDLTVLMEKAFATGSVSRIMTSMLRNAPFASDSKVLIERMQDNPALGWSCWDMSVLLTELLTRRGIEAGVTLAFGAEEKAPAQPHSLVRVTEEDGSYFYADPYFGVGVIAKGAPHNTWHSQTSVTHWTRPQRHSYTDKIFVKHRAHKRLYGYQILPGVLSTEQLQGALWQAEEFGGFTMYVRGVGAGHIWQIIRRDSDAAEQSTWDLDGLVYLDETPSHAAGNWYQLTEKFVDQTDADRSAALEELFTC